MDAGILVLSFAITLVVSRWVITYQKKLGLVDDPRSRKLAKNTHQYPVPRGGSLAIGIGVLVGLMFGWQISAIRYVFLAIGILMIVGFLDDKYQDQVPPLFRLGINIFVAGITVWGGIGIKYLTGLSGETTILPIVFGAGVTVLWLSWMQNIVGWSSGVDGQLPGFVVIAALVVGVWGGFRPDFVPPQILAFLATITVGSYLAFLVWNWYPQKIMPGYGGKSIAGYLLGVIAVLADVKLGTMAMILAVPFTDAVFAVIKRLLEGRSPFVGGRDHLHHFLLDRGWDKRQVAIFYWIASFLGGLIALQLKGLPSYFTMATVMLVTAGLVLWLRQSPFFSKPLDPGSGSKT